MSSTERAGKFSAKVLRERDVGHGSYLFLNLCGYRYEKLLYSQPDETCHLRIGASLMDTIDDLINEGHIEPQLAMKILGHFDRIVQEVLAEKVKARMSFKVCLSASSTINRSHLLCPFSLWR